MKKLVIVLNLLIITLTAAARNSHISTDSLINLGVSLKSTDPKSAERYLTMAAQNENPRAMTELGAFYVFTPGFSSQTQKGLQLLETAAGKGFGGADDYLGFYYFQKQDYDRAKKWFDARHDNHAGFAYAALGSMYLEGKGVRENGAKARENYRLSALNGYPRGMSLYASLLGTKNGGKINYPDAFFWHYIAGELGENYSRVMLYRPRLSEPEASGEVARDAQQALVWIEAVHKGKSMKNEPLYKDGFLKGLKEREAAAENGDDWSRFYLGSMNYHGDFLNQNHARAIYYYEPIIKNGKLPAPVLKEVSKRLAEMRHSAKGK
ncbi:MAG: sel1 repeat family protein [Muribaculaceae bacterium]|nr:sel1 repeat family protein [Muribaculaceae bacterium]